MFAVLIEAEPHNERRGAYLARADMLRPEIERASGFVDNVRYKSLTRDGWILSLSGWRDEASVVSWHTRMRDDEAREGGWSDLFADYRLRVGEVTSDTRLPEGQKIEEQRLDESESGHGTHVTLIDAKQTPEWVAANNPQEMALYLGFDLYSFGDCSSWDILDSLSSPGEIILMVTWRNAQSANDHAATQIVPEDARVRVFRVVRDDTSSGRREGTQSDPDAAGRETIGA
jgi:heme-degrading monooxygenase HmoA